jgi:hypothetical protein
MTLAARHMTSLRTVLTHQAGSPVSISFVALGAPPYFRTKRFVRFLFPEFLRWTCDVGPTFSRSYSWSFLSAVFDIYFGLSVSLFASHVLGLLQDNFSSVLP